MQSYYSAQVWNKQSVKLPYTCKTAKPSDWEQVSNVPVIHVIDAMYRNSTVSGTFVISPFVLVPISLNQSGKIDVLCRWFNHRLVSTGLSLIINLTTTKFDHNFTGNVISNIEK
ncbi:hypothetical protein [Limnohabitans sp. 15K]|uniref:hypothetical protein n=1 Tax=Limnohabitans sp. 15K TaxID=1100706 RepID=UPI00117AE43F|nr:hypothetical protein [Limnohabitans sp. 15K]